MHEILPKQLWIANARDARDLRLLGQHEIQAVVDLAINEPPAQLNREMIYCRIPLVDGDDNATTLIKMAIESTLGLIRNGFSTVVSCSAGMSRSPAIAAATMALLSNTSPDDCLLKIATSYPHDVSPALWASVKEVCNQIH